MQTVNQALVSGKRVLLRYDIDAALGKVTGNSGPPKGRVTEDFKLKAGLETLNLCLQHAQSVIMLGHVGRPGGQVVEELRVAPIVEWFRQNGLSSHLSSGKLKILENTRFDPREDAEDEEYAKEIAEMGDIYVNEAFSAHNPAVSTTVLPGLLPRAAGLHFVEEVRVLTEVRENPKKPLVAIMGGAKVKDKLPVIEVLAKKADAVLVGGKLVAEISEQGVQLPSNVRIGKLNEDGMDIAPETLNQWKDMITGASMIVWNGPVGKFEDPKYDCSAKLARVILECGGQIVVGGGDTVSLLGSLGLLGEYEKRGFVSVGGGAMLKLLSDGTLPTIDALE